MAETLNTHENGNCANRVLATVLFENYDDDDYYERQQEELQERAFECTCGAWKLGKSGEVHHVADCCCGAE